MIARQRVFKFPNFKVRGELALGFWWHASPHVAYKKLMLWQVCAWSYRKEWSVCVATFPDLYVMRWLSRFLKLFPRSRLNARAYSWVLSPQHLVLACRTPSHHALPCIQCLHGHSSLHLGSEIRILGSWQSQHTADLRTVLNLITYTIL